MASSNYLLIPGLTAFALFSACGGGGSDTFNSSGGGTSTDAGSSSVAGDSAVAGDNSGSESAGATGNGEAGFSGSDDGQAGGVGEAGQTGFVSGGTGGGDAGGSIGQAGAGGSGGHAGGGAGSGGMSMGGTHSGGSAGSGPEPTCAQLDAEAATQLSAAQACTPGQAVNECDARVANACGCEVPIESATSAASKTYLATLKTIAARKCPRPASCPACVAVGLALCSKSGKGSTDTCTRIN